MRQRILIIPYCSSASDLPALPRNSADRQPPKKSLRPAGTERPDNLIFVTITGALFSLKYGRNWTPTALTRSHSVRHLFIPGPPASRFAARGKRAGDRGRQRYRHSGQFGLQLRPPLTPALHGRVRSTSRLSAAGRPRSGRWKVCAPGRRDRLRLNRMQLGP